jgi:stress-induced-phosphoprotein 1
VYLTVKPLLADANNAAVHYMQVEHYTKETERLIKNTELEWRKLQAQEYIDPAKALEAKERGNDFFRAGNWVDAIKEYEVSQ